MTSFVSPRPTVLADAALRGAASDLALVVLGALLMSLLAQIAIPVPPSPVPVTGQTLGVVLCGATLGARRGTAAVVLYVATGLLLPVYADGTSGPAILFGATGGYLVGFVVAAYVIGRLAERGAERRPLTAVASFCLGQLIVFGVGVPWLKASTGMGWSRAIHDGFTVFIVGGIIKAVVAAVVIAAAWSIAAHGGGDVR